MHIHIHIHYTYIRIHTYIYAYKYVTHTQNKDLWYIRNQEKSTTPILLFFPLIFLEPLPHLLVYGEKTDDNEKTGFFPYFKGMKPLSYPTPLF